MINKGALALSELTNNKYREIIFYLSKDNKYWLNNDIWNLENKAFKENKLLEDFQQIKGEIDFSNYNEDRIKNEMKYYILSALKNKTLKLNSVLKRYRISIRRIGSYVNELNIYEFKDLEDNISFIKYLDNHYTKRNDGARWTNVISFKNMFLKFMDKFYDERNETEKDVWVSTQIPGVKLSACDIHTKSTISFVDIPDYYRAMIKRYLGKLITRRSWSYSVEMLLYIKYFFKVFYRNGYKDGFLEDISRIDIEKYLLWVMEDYKDKNDTYKSKTVSFIRLFLDYTQMAEFLLAPKKDISKLIFEDDIPRRERLADTREKIKYIPEPVREQIDIAIQDIEPKAMMRIYVLLRETGWRGTDILNLKYDNCLEYNWNKGENRYVPYLCGEITKTGIPRLKIPIRDEVEFLVKSLVNEVIELSTKENNPTKYLFNTYEGKKIGTPTSKIHFIKAVRQLIAKKNITDANGDIYHFKTHGLRHTRAVEYAEQNIPITVIKQILGHCSLQMTLHYAKVSENVLYEKWKSTEKLDLFRLDASPPKIFTDKEQEQTESIEYEFVRKTLDAVRVPFGTCFKPSKVCCKHQIEKCLECSNFCSTKENISEYESEITRVNELIKISQRVQRNDWKEKNIEYLNILEKMVECIKKQGILHKNGQFREQI